MKEIVKEKRKEEDISNRSMPLPICQQSTHTHLYIHNRDPRLFSQSNAQKAHLIHTQLSDPEICNRKEKERRLTSELWLGRSAVGLRGKERRKTLSTRLYTCVC